MKEATRNHLKQQFGIIGNAPALNRAIDVATLVAPTNLSITITGESGTGKESFSKLIHSLSPYKHNKFIAINCGAIPEGTIDSELFGHEKGAFTGATESRKGYFEETNGGTIFLDEIGDTPLSTQTKLLRILEYGEFIKVGSSKIQKTNVRVIAATNADLQQAIYAGKFREDLYYRLNTVPLSIPPLRERGTDIILLFTKFATEFADRYYIKPIQLDPEAKEAILNYRFPGNIRQLKNLVEQISILEIERILSKEKLQTYLPANQQLLPTLYQKKLTNDTPHDMEQLYKFLFELKRDIEDVKKWVLDFLTNQPKNRNITKIIPTLEEDPYTTDLTHNTDITSASPSPHLSLETPPSLADTERTMILQTLAKFDNNRKKTAQTLGISERTLYRKINQYESNL